MLLDACASFCTAMASTFGPTLTEYIFIAALAALGWWQARKKINGARADAQSAKAEVQEVKLSIAKIEGSLRPSAPGSSPPVELLGTPSSSSSGTFQPVVMPPRPSMPDPEFTELPPPSAVPTFDRPTPGERPRTK